MSQRFRWTITAAIAFLVGSIALAVVAATGSTGSGDEVRILARHLEDGRTEVALQLRGDDRAWGETVRPENRFLPADSEAGRWRSSTAIQIEDSDAVDASAVGLTATATLSSPDGADMGHVTLIQGPRGVLIQARLTNVPEGWHGFHIHETGSCDPDFSAAGDHYDPTGIGHGVLHEGGHHPGDTVNVYAHVDGTANADQYTVDATLGAGVTSLFDADGSAIIVHEGPDSYGEAPGAGARIACGVIVLDQPDS